MVEYIHKQEGIKHYHLFRTTLTTSYGAVFMDATEELQAASRADHRDGYDYEDGPRFGIEFNRAKEYAEYVDSCATLSNYIEFSTAKFGFSILADKFRKPVKKD